MLRYLAYQLDFVILCELHITSRFRHIAVAERGEKTVAGFREFTGTAVVVHEGVVELRPM